MKIEMGGKYTTRDGRPVRILCVDGPKPWPVAGYIGDCTAPTCWGDAGHYLYSDTEGKLCDLIPAKPEPVVEWGYRDGVYFYPCRNEQAARRDAAEFGLPLAKRTTEIIEP